MGKGSCDCLSSWLLFPCQQIIVSVPQSYRQTLLVLQYQWCIMLRAWHATNFKIPKLFKKCNEARWLLMMWACTQACSVLPVCSSIKWFFRVGSRFIREVWKICVNCISIVKIKECKDRGCSTCCKIWYLRHMTPYPHPTDWKPPDVRQNSLYQFFSLRHDSNSKIKFCQCLGMRLAKINMWPWRDCATLSWVM